MAKIYAELVRKGLRTIVQVPESKREEVKRLLIEMGYPELAGSNHRVQEG